MQKVALALAGAAALLAGPALEAKPRLTGEAKLARMLEGREAGEPVSCIPMYGQTDSTVIDKTAIVYKVGATYYVNRPAHPQSLDDDDILVVELRGSQLCRLDTVRTHDRAGYFYTGFVSLGDFVPYRKVKVAKAD